MPSRPGPTFDTRSRRGSTRAIEGEMLLDDRTRRRLHRIRWRRIGAAFGLICLVAALIGLYISPLMRVHSIEVTGASTVSADHIRDLAGLEGQSILRIDVAKAEGRIAALPMVREVSIAREWPQTVRIQVTERQPWAYWQIGDQRYVIDSEGIVLQGVAPGDNSAVIRDLGPHRDLQPGDRVDVDAVALTRSMLDQAYGRLALNVTETEFSPATGLTVTTDAGYRVVVGDSQNLDYKLAVWQAIENEMGRPAMVGRVLDLRFGDRPAFQ